MTRTLSVIVRTETTDLEDLHRALGHLFDTLPAGFSIGPWQVSDSEA